jgi:DNA-binding PucR family transcriptional regulator
MYEFLAERIPEAAADEEIAGLTLASCSSNIETVLSMLRNGIPASAAEAPVTALEHARAMAARGSSVDATLRFYRLGHAYFWDMISAALVKAVSDRDRLVIAMREASAFSFQYIDTVSARVNDEHIAERDRRRRRAAIVRDDIVRQLMAGQPVDRDRAELALGHRLDSLRQAFVAWTDSDATSLERAAMAVARAAGVQRPLVVSEGSQALGCWLTATVEDTEPLAAAAAEAAPDVHLAFGDPGEFRRSRETADRARRMAELAGSRAPTFTRYADVALADLLTADLEAAKAFADAELGALAGDLELQRTVLAVVAPGGGLAAAARELDVHRNTVLQRVRRAEDLRGRPVSHRSAELHAALLVVRFAQASG